MNFWLGKRVLITGCTGFKGSWLSIVLHKLGAEVYGLGLKPKLETNLFYSAKVDELIHGEFIDINYLQDVKAFCDQVNPEIVFHMAAQPLVRQSYSDPLETFKTNVIGTANILEALVGNKSLKSLVCITTDKVYENKEHNTAFREDDTLGGFDPYSASKACAEFVLNSYRNSFYSQSGVQLSSARAGNVIGGGDWSEDRLIPDIIKAWYEKKSLIIRNPNSVRPWQHVLESIYGYLSLAEKSCHNTGFQGAYNFGPASKDEISVDKIVLFAQDILNGLKNVEIENESKWKYEAKTLRLDISKSRKYLSFYPKWNVETAVKKSLTWYKNFYSGSDAYTLCTSDIEQYIKTNL